MIYLPSDKPHHCSKRMMICKNCNYIISSYSKKCIVCETNSKELICKICSLTFDEEKNPIYCSCTNTNIEGGRPSDSEPVNLVTKYAVGMENSIMDIHLNPNFNKIWFPHEYILNKKKHILS